MTQLRCKFGPLIFLIRESGCNSVEPNLEKSSEGHGSNDMPPPLTPLVTGDADTPLRMTPFIKPCTSSNTTRPLGPLPCTCARSTPSSRANFLMEGEAWDFPC